MQVLILYDKISACINYIKHNEWLHITINHAKNKMHLSIYLSSR